MTIGQALATSAILGILSGVACGGAQADAKAPSTDPASGSAGVKNGCGNHPDGGSCGAMDTPASGAKK